MLPIEQVLKYSFALFVVSIATLMRLYLHSILQERMPFVTYTLAVMLIAWVCGAYPAIMALGLSTVAAAQFFILPESSLSISDPTDQLAVATFFIIGIFSILLLRRLEGQRERALAQALENQDLNDKLRELDLRKDEFISLLAHELRSPMAPIRNAIALIAKHSQQPRETQAMLDVISRNFKHLVRLVDDLLDVSRYLRGSIALRAEVINLGDCLIDAIEMSNAEITDKKHELIVDLPTQPVYIEADPVRVSQIFSNLLSNAAKYTPENGCIHLSFCRHADHIEIAIQDNGLGISEAIQEQIFSPFFQANPKQTRYASGLGLGLTIVKKLVELHGGCIQVVSRGANTGSRFVLSFPQSIVREEPLQPRPTSPQNCGERPWESTGCSSVRASNTGAAQRVVIADDDTDTAQTLQQLLLLEGFLVEVAPNGLSALRLCRSFRPNVLLLDIGLPEIDGFGVARQLRSEPLGESLKIIAISGWGTEAHKEAGADAGFDLHLVKPVAFEQLLHHLAHTRLKSLRPGSACTAPELSSIEVI